LGERKKGRQSEIRRETMKVLLNGEIRDTGSAGTVAQLVETLGWPAAVLLVEHNGEALRREDWACRPLGEGDRLEVIRIVAGG
jgi:thiamine biosynthesis protein ThiS